jgi:hypothetical protein
MLLPPYSITPMLHYSITPLFFLIRVPEPALLALRRRKFRDLLPARAADALHYHLRQTIHTANYRGLFSQIDDDHLNFTAIIRIDGSGAIDKRKSVFESETAPRPDLRLKPRRQGDGNSRGNQRALERRQYQIRRQIRKQIHPRRSLRHIARQGNGMLVLTHASNLNRNLFHGCRATCSNRARAR